MAARAAELDAALRAQAANDWVNARRLFAQAHEAAPEAADITLELAICALRTADATEALRLTTSIKDPRFVGRAAIIRARVLQAGGHLDLAARDFERGIADERTTLKVRASAMRTLADLRLNQFGDPAGAAELLGRLRGTAPAKAEEAALVADLYLGGRRSAELSTAFRDYAHRHIVAEHRLGRLQAKPRRKRAVIGVLSPALFATPVGFLTLGTLQHLAAKADLVFFDRRPQQDWLSAALRQTATAWHDVATQDAATLAATIKDANLDALIDCGGWMDMTAMTALSMRPCRRQLKWVGGQALTTGLDCFDGFLTDARQVPVASQSLYVEPILRFATSYVTYVPPPYFDYFEGQARSLSAALKPRRGDYALVSNPAKISAQTLEFVRQLKPRKLTLIDTRWRYEHTRLRLGSQLEGAAKEVHYVTPANHREYLETLRDTAATFIDTRPYSMGMTAIELMLLGKTYVGPRLRPGSLMYERHSHGHERAIRFDHYQAQAAQLLGWCKGR